MIFRIHAKSFFIGVGLGSFLVGIATLFSAQLASPLWVVEEDLRRSSELESQARKAYASGSIEEAFLNIRSARLFREMMPSINKDRWPLTFPMTPLYLGLGGIEQEQFVGSQRKESMAMIYRCAEVYLLHMRQMQVEVKASTVELKAKFPAINVERCISVAQEYLKPMK